MKLHPFLAGHVAAAAATGGVASAMIGGLDRPLLLLAWIAGFAAAAGAASFICRWRPGFEAPAWKLWPAAVATNPIFLVALGFMVDDAGCFVGGRSGWNCLPAAIALLAALLCLIPPLGGLLWRTLRRRAATASAPPP